MMFHDLFVYGTLMKGQSSHKMMDDAIFLRAAQTAPLYHLIQFDNDYIGLMTGGNQSISGEIYRVSTEHLWALDDYELDIYSRQIIELEDGDLVDAYVFKKHLLNFAGERIEFLKGFN